MNAKTGAMLLITLGLASTGPLVSQAQDSSTHRDDRQAQKDAADVHSEAAKEGRENDRINNDPSLNNDQSRRPDDGRGATDRVADLHRAHPHAAARCHDGFFTTTHDRSRACSRHGGIDVWLIG
jgi:hypothetical protein